MYKLLAALPLVIVTTALPSPAAGVDPVADLRAYQHYFQNRFPGFTPVDFSNGMYNFNADKRQQWEAIMEFPPYEIALAEGETLYNKPFANGKGYADCFENGGVGIAHTYPRFDTKTGKVITLAGEVNACRTKHGEEPLPHLKGKMASVLAYMANTSRGKPINISIPDDPRALAAYEDGKRIYFTRRGSRAFACYHCHWEAAGANIRGNELSTAIGQAANFPTYRSKWGEMGTLQRRYKGCMNNIGAQPLKEETEPMNNLEYFHTYLSNGVPLNAPGTRF